MAEGRNMLHYLSCDGLALRVELLWAGLRADSFWAVWEFNSGGKKKKKKAVSLPLLN